MEDMIHRNKNAPSMSKQYKLSSAAFELNQTPTNFDLQTNIESEDKIKVSKQIELKTLDDR